MLILLINKYSYRSVEVLLAISRPFLELPVNKVCWRFSFAYKKCKMRIKHIYKKKAGQRILSPLILSR